MPMTLSCSKVKCAHVLKLFAKIFKLSLWKHEIFVKEAHEPHFSFCFPSTKNASSKSVFWPIISFTTSVEYCFCVWPAEQNINFHAVLSIKSWHPKIDMLLALMYCKNTFCADLTNVRHWLNYLRNLRGALDHVTLYVK